MRALILGLLLSFAPSAHALDLELTPYVFTKFSAGWDFPAGASVGTETVSGLFELGADHKSGFGVYANYYIADSQFGTFSTTFIGVSYKFYSPLDRLFQ